MKKFLVVAAAFVLMFTASFSFAVTDEEIFRSFSLNLQTPGARATAMGGAFIGLADDATAAETNPAGLAILAKPEVSLEYRYADRRGLQDNIVGIPTYNYDLTPSPVTPGFDTPYFSEFHSNDRADSIQELGFLSFVYPFHGITLAVSRHSLINTQTTLFGSLSASPFHFVEPNSFLGTSNIQDVNYNFSLAGKISDKFLLGAGLKISDLKFNSSIGAREKSELVYGEHFQTSIDEHKQKVGANVGILVRPNSSISLGLVYKYEPKFDLNVLVNNTDFHSNPLVIARSGSNSVAFDIPDQLGFGVSVVPFKGMHLNMDFDRIFYSQLAPIENGFSLFTHLLPVIDQANEIKFDVKDRTDFHVGGEYLCTSGTTTYGVRAGYARIGSNRFFLSSAANPQIQEFLAPIFGTGPANYTNHWTFGAGFTHGPIQLDAAVDMAQKHTINDQQNYILNKQENQTPGYDLIISTVYRF